MKAIAIFCMTAVAFAAPQASDPGMRAAWGIRDASDEVMRLAGQLGVRDVVIYGGPAATNTGTDRPLNKPRTDYNDYLSLRRRLEWSAARRDRGRIPAFTKYHDVAFGGPKRDELINELIAEIREMGRAGVLVDGYHWMPLLVWRTKPVKIRGVRSNCVRL